MQNYIIIALVLGIIALVATATILAHQGKKVSPEEMEDKSQSRIHRPDFTPVLSIPEDERESIVDHLLKRKRITYDEKKFIYDFLMETGKEKWRYIDGYWGYYRISSTGIVESCRRHNLLNPSERVINPAERKKAYQVMLSVNGEAKGFSVHKLVAETFIPNPSAAVTVVPIDGEYRHCDVRNLMWKLQASSTKIATKNETAEAA